MNFRSMEEFWAFYVSQHSKAATRRWHFAATLSSSIFLVLSVLFKWWFVFFMPLVGYGLAWYSHFFIEGNVPATFGHPFWSLLCDYKMFGLMLTGKMDKEIKRLGKRPVLQVF
ncbi:transmembrane protein [Thalictrum thalictroides]|uniref:Transmembrane protein n=1 Tax=Thalictrum thalictroides TaxID=46969 RepID=A0A7J6VAE7_THATH|nr:transmembrane protein [Thalictrum thalictroides]